MIVSPSEFACLSTLTDHNGRLVDSVDPASGRASVAGSRINVGDGACARVSVRRVVLAVASVEPNLHSSMQYSTCIIERHAIARQTNLSRDASTGRAVRPDNRLVIVHHEREIAVVCHNCLEGVSLKIMSEVAQYMTTVMQNSQVTRS